MASSYTPLLGLVLPVTGELAGTWGTVWNDSGTSLLDSAVSGTTTLSTDADVTLTTTTGASNQARQAILLCSGARTVLRNITAPAQSKLYVVINSTTGGFGVVIRGVGPTTGVTVANGKTAVVVWNGTDFVEVAPAVATTATNLAGGVAGSLPYQSGASTTTFLGIGTANYVLTSTGTAPTWTLNTGTGNVVRATSPTLVTPTLGVASATTINKVTLTAPATGSTLTIADGKTLTASNTLTFTGTDASSVAFGTGGTVTYTSNNLSVFAATTSAQLAGVISDETGSGSLVFGTSPTLATPTFTTSATVPLLIGGTTTTSTLTLRSTSGVGTTGADIIFQTGNNGATEAMRVLNSGSVGIGTSSPTGGLVIAKANNNGTPIFGVTDTGGVNNSYLNLYSRADALLFATSKNGTGTIRPIRFAMDDIGNATTSVSLALETNGNVGIGTTTPTNFLSLGGNAARTIWMERHTTANTAGNNLTLQSGGATSGATDKTGGALLLSSGTATGTGTSIITFLTATAGSTGTVDNAPAERMRINSIGNLLIGGTTPQGSTRVELLGTNDATSTISLYRSDSARRAIVGADYIGSFTNNSFDLFTNSISRLSITGAGVVSIQNLTASQAVFTDASKNLVSNAITGSGSVVMSTSPTLVTPILGTPTSGTLTNCTGLPVATGISGFGTGVATFLATPSSANLAAAVTNETGTGALVFATSPTLVTPLLGTPTSGTLTSCTGLPLTTGVTGTLPVANGGTGITSLGTGVATWLGTPSSANLLAAMTDETGTGALVFATSPTLVTPNIGAATGTSLAATGGTVLVRAAATQDGVQLQGRAGGTGSWEVAITPTTLTADRTVTLADGNTTLQAGTMAVTGTGLNQFAATTSAQLAGVISDETGTGSLVFGTSPTFTTSATAPLVIGGTGTTSPLALRSTSGVGTTGADIIFQVGNNGATEAMRVLNDGRVGIGTNAPSYRFDVQTSTNVTQARFSYGGTGGATITSTNSGQAIWAAGFEYNGTAFVARSTAAASVYADDGYIAFTTNTGLTSGNTFTTTERMRIDTAGYLLIDKTAANLGSTGIELKPGGFAQFTGNLATTNELVNFNNINAGNIAYDIAFRQQSTIVGSIRTNSASVSYNTTSDYRLKENVTPIAGALAKVAALKPVTYTWKVDGEYGEGFIAHELQEICPLAVTGEKDAVSEDGKPVHQGIDPSKIIALLTAAIQEQQATITALTTRIAALEAK